MNNDRKRMWGILFISAFIVLGYNLTTHDLLGFKLQWNSLVKLNLMGIVISGIYIMSLMMYICLNAVIAVDIKNDFISYVKGFAKNDLYCKGVRENKSLIYSVCAILGLILMNAVLLLCVL